MKTIYITQKAASRLKAGYPILHDEDFIGDVPEIMDFVQFSTKNHEKVAVGYLGKQHKGRGFVIHTHDNEVTLSTFIYLFKSAREKRESFENNEALTNAYRIFNAEGDGIGGITVDYYNGFAVISFYNETIYYHRQKVIQALQVVYGKKIKGMYEKIRFESKTLQESAWIWGEKANEPHLIKENGIIFPTYMNEGLMTGIFLDQHDVRGRLVNGEACGLSVLNTFSYTGAFSVSAAMGGAIHTVSVDLARRSLEKTREVFEVNGLNPDDHEIRVMDIFDYVKWARKKEKSFDMIILDPPSFARNGKKVFSVAKDYGRLVSAVLPLLKDGGVLIASTNAANVSLSQYKKMIEGAFKQAGCSFNEKYFDTLPQDFVISPHYKEGNYLKVITYEVRY